MARLAPDEKLCAATLSSSSNAERENFWPLIQKRVASSTVGKTVSRQSAADDMMAGSSRGGAMGLAPSLSALVKKELNVGYLAKSGCASSSRGME